MTARASYRKTFPLSEASMPGHPLVEAMYRHPVPHGRPGALLDVAECVTAVGR